MEVKRRRLALGRRREVERSDLIMVIIEIMIMIMDQIRSTFCGR